MDDNTSIQFRLRLAQINGIKMNEEQIHEAAITQPTYSVELARQLKQKSEAKDHVSTEIDYIGDASDRKKDAETHGVKITPSRKKVQDSDHSVSGPRENVRKFLTHHYGGDKDEAKENHPEVFKGMNEEKIDEAGSIKHTDRVLYSNKKRDPEIGHMRNIVHAYFVARANDKDPEDVMGAHRRAAEAAAAKHPTDHMGRPTHAAHVENAVRRHLEYVSGRIPNPSASGSDGNQVRQGLRGNQN